MDGNLYGALRWAKMIKGKGREKHTRKEIGLREYGKKIH